MRRTLLIALLSLVPASAYAQPTALLQTPNTLKLPADGVRPPTKDRGSDLVARAMAGGFLAIRDRKSSAVREEAFVYRRVK